MIERIDVPCGIRPLLWPMPRYVKSGEAQSLIQTAPRNRQCGHADALYQRDLALCAITP